MSLHQNEFSARLARIEAGIGSSKTMLYVGMDETYSVSYGRRGANKGKSCTASGRSSGNPAKVLLAFLVGIAANVAARFADFTLNGLPSDASNVDMQLATQFGTALVACLLLGLFFGIRMRDLVMMRVMGIGAGMVGLHNAVHAYPQYFEMVFSRVWVSHITSVTEAGSILWRGASIAI